MNLFLFVETFGCQMNDRDSEIMQQLLEQRGYLVVDRADQADVIIVNTCSIRGKAEQKAFSLLGSYKKLKVNKPDLVIAVTGCVAQQEGNQMRSRMPHIDLVIGPQGIYDVADLVDGVINQQKKAIATAQNSDFVIPPFLPDLNHGWPHKRFVTIMQGCNNYCTYCIVPYTRGREVSRNSADIINEVKHLIAGGVKEITLLGQNVNSYGHDQQFNKRLSFPQLLTEVANIPGLSRLRFTTSNPKDLSPDLMICFRDLPNLCHHFHLPVQSGSNHILKKMNRKYTRESYLDLVAGLRQNCPNIALTTDVIVGFSGESDKDFKETMDLMEQVRYHSSYSFKYSPRPPAKACEFGDDVPQLVKKERLALLHRRQKEITAEIYNDLIGQKLELMVEGESRTGAGQYSGRSSYNILVNFVSSTDIPPGELVTVEITEVCLNSLRGKITND